MVISESERDDQRWEFILRRWPQMHVIDTFVKRVPDVAARYGLSYCRGQWIAGPKDPRVNDGIPGLGIRRAVRHLALNTDISRVMFDVLTKHAIRMMPSCTDPDCALDCKGGWLMTTERKS